MPSSHAQYRARQAARELDAQAAIDRDLAAYRRHHQAVYGGTIRGQDPQALKCERAGLAAQLSARDDLADLKRARMEAERDAIDAELARQARGTSADALPPSGTKDAVRAGIESEGGHPAYATA